MDVQLTPPNLYDLIGVDYNSTRRADPFLSERFLSLLSLEKNSQCLDVGCGSGNYTAALADRGECSFYGVEPSEVMLNEARRKSGSVQWMSASGENLPFENEFFDAALASLTIHHWKSIEKGFAEVSRVLKKGGNFIIFTAFLEQMENYWLNHYFPVMLKDSIAVMPSRKIVENALNFAGFVVIEQEKYFVQPDLQDLFLYSGKYRPALYLDAQVRRGISSFAALGNAEEIEKGLQKLSADLENGNFTDVISNYRSDAGDYVFIVAKKVL